MWLFEPCLHEDLGKEREFVRGERKAFDIYLIEVSCRYIFWNLHTCTVLYLLRVPTYEQYAC